MIRFVFVLIFGLTVLQGGALPVCAAVQDSGPSPGLAPAYVRELRFFIEGLFREEALAEKEAPEEVEEAEEKFHVVEPGETLTGIARLYGMKVEDLAAINAIRNPNLIMMGQSIKVEFPGEIQHTLVRGETLAALALSYGAELEELKEANHQVDPYRMPVGMVVTIPNPTRMPPPAPAVLPASRSFERVASAPGMVWPLRGIITSRYGVLRSTGYHWGLDIAAPRGTPIKAAAAGTVTRAERRGNYGLMVTIDHGGGWATLYAHASRLLVSRGQQVTRGQDIALVGTTGNSTGPHLHLEVILNGERLNPELYLPR